MAMTETLKTALLPEVLAVILAATLKEHHFLANVYLIKLAHLQVKGLISFLTSGMF